MKACIFILVISLVTISCKENSLDTSVPETDYLSTWFIQNEDSLYYEFIKTVKDNFLSGNTDTSWGEVALKSADSLTFMGRFTLETKKYCDSLEVTFFYNKGNTPHSRILITTNYNRTLTKALDSIFKIAPNPKHFVIEKYEQPNWDSDGFAFPNLNIDNKDLRILIKQNGKFSSLKIYIFTKNKNVTIDNENQEILKKGLFGEELLLKKIDEIEFHFTDSINHNYLTLNEARNKLR